MRPRKLAGIKRSVRPKTRKADPSKRRFAARRDAEFCEFIRGLPCILADLELCEGHTEVAHVKTRAAGAWDRGDSLPLCTRHHRMQHSIGIKSFERRFNVDLESIAAGLAA